MRTHASMMTPRLAGVALALALIAGACHADERPRIDPATGIITPAPSCATLAASARAHATLAASAPVARMVVGNGRLQFMSAPDEHCAEPGLFMVPGDSLNVKAEQGAYALVAYTNPKTHAHVEGWVHNDRLAMIVDDKD